MCFLRFKLFIYFCFFFVKIYTSLFNLFGLNFYLRRSTLTDKHIDKIFFFFIILIYCKTLLSSGFFISFFCFCLFRLIPFKVCIFLQCFCDEQTLVLLFYCPMFNKYKYIQNLEMVIYFVT